MDFNGFLLLLGFTGLLAVIIFLKKKQRSTPVHVEESASVSAIPSPVAYDPKLGNLGDLAKAGSLHQYLQLLHNQYGPVAGFRYFDQFVVSLAGPEVFRETNKLFNRPVPLFSLFRPLIGEESIQYANDEDGKKRRKLLDPFFAHASVKKIFPVFIEASNLCINNWEKGLKNADYCTVNLKEGMFDIAIYAIALSACGSEFSEEKRKNLRQSYDHCWNEMELSIKGSPIEDGSPRQAIFNQHRDNLFGIVQDMIDARANVATQQEEGPNKGVGGFLDFLIQQQSISEEQIKCDTIAFLIGGFHTTANFLIWAMYFFAKFPEYQSLARKEISSILNGEEVAFEKVTGMPYTTAFLNETLRYAILAPFAGRYSDEEEIIGGYAIPKKTMIVQALGVALNDPKSWNSPNTFSPQRFLDSSDSPASASWSFKPFGVGNRMCPASKYAMLETKAIIAKLLPVFEFNLLPGQPEVTAEYGLVGQVREDLFLRITPLNK